MTSEIWHEQCSVFFTWVRHGRPMTREWTATIIDRAIELGCEAMIFGIQLGGHLAYRSDISPAIPTMEDDVLGQLCEDGHAKGLRIVPMFITTTGGCAVEALEHPDWVSVDHDGARLGHLCYSSPFGDFTEAQVREVLARHPIDGLYFDQLSATCYCRYCSENFRRRFDREMPKVPNLAQFTRATSPIHLDDPGNALLLQEFRVANARHFCRRIRRAIDEIKPDTVYIQNWLFGSLAEDCAEFIDGILPELHLTTDVNSIAITNRVVGAYSGRPIWANVSHAYHHHGRVHTVDHTHLLLMEGAAARCSPTIVELNASDDNRNRYEDLKEAMRQIRWSSDALKAVRPLKYAAILHSRSSQEVLGEEFSAAFEGFYEVLASQHLPLEVITEKVVQEGALEGFAVLVIPNAACLADGTVKAIRNFVDAGGGLVATYRTGMCDEAGNLRPRQAISDLTGVDPIKVIAWNRDEPYPDVDVQVPIPSVDLRPGRAFFRYVRPVDGSSVAEGIEGRLLSFQGPYVDVDALDGTEPAAYILEMDQTLVNMRPFNRRGLFPGAKRWPLVTLRDGPGRVAYVAGQLGPAENREESYEIDRLLRNVVVWAGGPPPIEAPNAPPTVRLSLSENDDSTRLVIIITNQTTHRIRSGSIRYVVPVGAFELRLSMNGKKVTDLRTATGDQLDLRYEEDQAAIAIPSLRVAETLTLKIE